MTDIVNYIQETQQDYLLPLVKAYSFNTQYGNEEDSGNIIHVELDPGNSKITLDNKEIILVVDISASTKNSLKEIKSSLLAFRDTLLGYSAKELMLYTEAERDMILRNLIPLKLITFNNIAQLTWDKTFDITFEEAVLGLTTSSLTNIHAGLELTFSLVDPNIFTWIVVITDGQYNKGEYLTVNTFQKYIDRDKSYNSKIITLAYGKEFNPEVLIRIGTFSYVEEKEYIPVILANIADEILYSIGFNCFIDLDIDSDNIIYSDIIIASGVDISDSKVIIGSKEIGTIVTGSSYTFVYLPNNKYHIDNYQAVNIVYTDISTSEEINMSVGITPVVEAEDVIFLPELRSKYFSQLKDNILYQLYQAFIKSVTGDIVEDMKLVKNMLKTWSNKSSKRYELDIQYLLSEIHNSESIEKVKVLLTGAIATKYDNIEAMSACLALTSSNWYLQSLID